ncbi:MAG: ferredoxin family protein [Lentisphaerota bacterium]
MAVKFSKYELCTGCGNCVITCPCDVFRLDKEKKKTKIEYPEECQVCSMCTIYCPLGVLEVTPEKVIQPMTAYM